MAFCTSCGNPVPDNAPFCEKCGAPQNFQPGQPYPNPYAQPYVDPSDHTAQFDPADISENKVFALAAYLMGVLGLILAMLAAPNSKYAAFHCRQALKLQILTILVALVSGVLCWTVIVPIVGAVCGIVLLVVQCICFCQTCAGKAKDAPIVGSIGFLK